MTMLGFFARSAAQTPPAARNMSAIPNSQRMMITSRPGDGSLEGRIIQQPTGQPGIARGERMTGVSILLAGQGRRYRVWNLLCLQPVRDRRLHLQIPLEAL